MKDFFIRLKELSGEDIFRCYQCGKCSAGCPAVKHMSILPNRVIRRLQNGQKDAVLNEEAIWRCASCMTCWSRCPRGVNLCNIMEALRIIYMTEYRDNCPYTLEGISKELLSAVPQQAIVSGFRKFFS